MSNYIYDTVEKLCKKYKTRDPFELLNGMNVIVTESFAFSNLKGFCFLNCRTTYVVINGNLTDSEKRIVAAHELGHIVLHKDHLKLAPMKDSILYDMTGKLEYQANSFAADLLIPDAEIRSLLREEEMDYFTACHCLDTAPDLISFKLFSLMKRGDACVHSLPFELNSRFLKE